MTVLKALAILEAAVSECTHRKIDTPEVREALDFLEPHVRPEWLIPQFRFFPRLGSRNRGSQERSTTGALRNAPRNPGLGQRANRKTNRWAGATVCHYS